MPVLGLPCAILEYAARLTQFTMKRDQSQILYAALLQGQHEM